MKLVLALCLVALASAHLFTNEEYRIMWAKFQAEHNKVYTPEEYLMRFQTFCDNVDFIESHNQLGLPYTLGINSFADLSWEEFSAMYLSMKPIHNATNVRSLRGVAVPDAVDWTTKGATTPVKDQGQCGSCWAFSAVAALEAYTYIHGQKLVDLSEQELVDCSRDYGNEGCNGGLMDQAFQYVQEKGGLCKQGDYKYTHRDGQCKSSKCTHAPESVIEKFTDVPASKPNELLAAAAETVVSVAIDAESSFQFYSGGIYTGPCGTDLNHGVALVGYGKDSKTGKLFWKVKNSWGSGWGEKGFIRMNRVMKEKDDGICGICMISSYIPNDQ